MLATPGPLPPTAQDAQWAYETKQDGQRVLVYLPGDGSVLLRARSGEDITGAYPELLALGRELGTTPAILDGEVLALDEQGRADFQLLQGRMGLAASPAQAARRATETPVHLVLFDIPHLGQPLLTLPYVRRRAALEQLGLNGPYWSTPAALTGHGAEALRATREHGLERGRACRTRRAAMRGRDRRPPLRPGAVGRRRALGGAPTVGEVRYSTRTRAGMLRQPSWPRLRPDLAPAESAADPPDRQGSCVAQVLGGSLPE